jgi:poly(3-hydroxybutyrate) depolymerase
MRVEEIGEIIEVIALFHSGKLAPLKFRWRERVYRVNRIHGGWTTEEGAARLQHYAVAADGPDVYELSYNERGHDWKIEKVSLNG